MIQQQVEVEGGDDEREQWREFVADLWEKRLPHLREEVYNDGAFVYDPHTGRYGFQEGSEYDSEGELMDDLMNEPEKEGHTEDSFLVISEDKQQSLESSRRERAGHSVEPKEEDESKCHSHVVAVWPPLHMTCTCSGTRESPLHGQDATRW